MSRALARSRKKAVHEDGKDTASQAIVWSMLWALPHRNLVYQVYALGKVWLSFSFAPITHSTYFFDVFWESNT